MLALTRLNGTTIFINENNILWVESMPDSTLTFLNGSKLIVQESIEEILEKVKAVSSKGQDASL